MKHTMDDTTGFATEEDQLFSDEVLMKMRQAEKDHPETEHTSAGGWCKHCGCGNDVLGKKHLRSCNRPQEIIVYLREVDAGTDNACWVLCAKGDSGSVAFAPLTTE